jgi:hypothetical protein
MSREKDGFPVPPPHVRVRWHGGGRGGTAAEQFVSFFHESFPEEVEHVAEIAQDIVTEARGLDAARVQAGACERLRLFAWRLWIAAQQVEESVDAYYGTTPAPGGGCDPAGHV